MLSKSDLIPYWFTREVVVEAGDFKIPQYCNGFLATNIAPVGGAIAFVNGFPINPTLVAGANGESFGLGGNFGEVLAEQQLEITFGAGTARVFLTMKFYSINC